MSFTLNRRSLLAAGLSAGALLAAGCSTNSGPGGESDGSAPDQSKAPTYRPVTLAEPDLPGSDLVNPGYFTYPSDPTPAYDSPPAADLDSVSILYNTFVPVPNGPDGSSFWRLAQDGLGTELKLQPTPNSEYGKVFPVIVASGDMPDVMMFKPNQARATEMIDSLFADLGPYLTGDAALDYPHLANIPTPSWRAAISGQKLFAVPQPRDVAGGMTYIREDLFEKAGLNPEPANGEELIQLLRDIKATGNDAWGWSNVPLLHTVLLGMMGAPNVWRAEEDGSFTSHYPSAEYREALLIIRDAFKAGLFHPNAASATYSQFRDHFFAGQTWMHNDGPAGWDLFVRSVGDRGTVGTMIPPAWEGGGQTPQWAGKGYLNLTVISNQVPEEKLPQILKVLDYFAAPIGSMEHLQRKFGEEGTDHTWEAGGPELTEEGQRNLMDFQYIVDSPLILGPGDEESVRMRHQWYTDITKNLIYDDSIGLVSETANNDGGPLTTAISDAAKAVMFDRGPVEDYDKAIDDWNNRGGAQIAEEYAEAYAARQAGN
ncbi:extracellular solute-binding protein [Parenemella sanctibonifatiensis]|uniref:Extracellular solute-binding protein n=1 Tax=Parenemella sanctibonifatiensis TaxID=2016505 RepID=A0A255EJD4_9ACTN|nr:extracellular solute-binding protein [Parenemella sanctibonifatiensis]OYN91091.1 hypothetical protein CGZ91_06430 [Parenemella sanctibonifatiensis]